MRVCRRCGTGSAATVEYCPSCGYTSFVDAPDPPAPATHAPDRPRVARTATGSDWLVLASGVCLVVPLAGWFVARLLILLVPSDASGPLALAAGAIGVLGALVSTYLRWPLWLCSAALLLWWAARRLTPVDTRSAGA